jgi:hypothetical protein
MVRARDEFPVVFSGGGSTEPHSAEYRQFSQDWGFQKTLFELADEKIEKVAQIKQEYLTDILFYLTYLIKKGEMEKKEDKWQENRRRAMKHK